MEFKLEEDKFNKRADYIDISTTSLKSPCGLIKLDKEPQVDFFENTRKNLYILNDKNLWYFDSKSRQLNKLNFKPQSSIDKLKGKLKLTENRDATQKDLDSIKYETGHNPANDYLNEKVGVQGDDDRYTEDMRDWQFRISVYPSESNLYNAAQVIDRFFENNKQTPSFWVKCYTLPSSDKDVEFKKKDWDPQYLTGNDRDQRGREVCVYMSLKDKETKQYAKSAQEWKELMLSLWKALQDAGVQVGYTATISGDKAVPCEQGLLTPFSYTAFKPYRFRHGILNQTHNNPYGFDDPLEGMSPITSQDLERHEINQSIVADDMRFREVYARQHIQALYAAISERLNAVILLDSYNAKDYAPINAGAQIVDKSTTYQLEGQAALDEIDAIKEDFKQEVIVSLLDQLGFAATNINECIENAPSEMQKIYRGLVHALHEQSALENDLRHFRGEEPLPFDKIQPVPLEKKPVVVEAEPIAVAEEEPSKVKETIIDLAIAAGITLGCSAAGAGIGALVGTFLLPGVGTVMGAVIGTLFGGNIGLAVTGLQGMVRNRLSGANNVEAEKASAGVLTTFGATGLGALIGTIIAPGLGTAVGAGIGLVVGVTVSVLTSYYSSEQESQPSLLVESNDSVQVTKGKNPYSHPDLQHDPSYSKNLEQKEQKSKTNLVKRDKEAPLVEVNDSIDDNTNGPTMI